MLVKTSTVQPIDFLVLSDLFQAVIRAERSGMVCHLDPVSSQTFSPILWLELRGTWGFLTLAGSLHVFISCVNLFEYYSVSLWWTVLGWVWIHFFYAYKAFPRVLQFIPTYQKNTAKWIGYVKLPLGVKECVNVCLCSPEQDKVLTDRIKWWPLAYFLDTLWTCLEYNEDMNSQCFFGAASCCLSKCHVIGICGAEATGSCKKDQYYIISLN